MSAPIGGRRSPRGCLGLGAELSVALHQRSGWGPGWRVIYGSMGWKKLGKLWKHHEKSMKIGILDGVNLESDWEKLWIFHGGIHEKNHVMERNCRLLWKL